MYATLNPISIDVSVWYHDSAAASHMMPNDGNLFSKSIYSSNALVNECDGILLPVAHIRTSILLSRHYLLSLKDVLHIPKLQHNLLSVRQFWG